MTGKFPHAGRHVTLHAAHDGRHRTQSAGLVAVNPIGYDPDGVFTEDPHDQYGFVGAKCTVPVAATVTTQG